MTAMNAKRRRRYELRAPELNRRIEELIEAARAEYGDRTDDDYVRQIMVTAVRLMRDGAYRGDVKMVNSALKELRHSFFVFDKFRHVRKVAVFGSARTKPEHPDWQAARTFAQKIVDAGWMVITGAGDGIMGAAQGGAGREKSFGVNIRLPFEQAANETIAGDLKLINYRYFFTRKVMFVKESHAIALFPGGFGTHDEGFEALTLMQTGKSELVPVVFVDQPGGSYWKDWDEYVRSHLHERRLISDDDLSLYRVTDSVDDAAEYIFNFYSNYHSSRYVKDLLVIRVRSAPNEAQLAALNEEFADILAKGSIAVSAALPEEAGEVSDLPRVTMHFDRHGIGRLRQLVDRLNEFVHDRAPHPTDAAPHEIVPESLSEEQETAEEDEP